MRTCPTCGAVTLAPDAAYSRLDSIPGNEQVKRAIEVALTGSHSLTITGWASDSFAEWVAANHGYAMGIQPCYCGNYGSARYECKCTPPG